jgi:hypothetical protein
MFLADVVLRKKCWSAKIQYQSGLGLLVRCEDEVELTNRDSGVGHLSEHFSH